MVRTLRYTLLACAGRGQQHVLHTHYAAQARLGPVSR